MFELKCSFNCLLAAILPVMIILVMNSKICESNSAALCVQFGVRHMTNVWDVGDNLKGRYGMYTVGTRIFDAAWLGSFGVRYEMLGSADKSFISPDNAACPYQWAPPCQPSGSSGPCIFEGRVKIEPCVPNSHTRLNMYLVKQNGRILSGWLHVELELLDTEDEIELVYIQMRDEQFNPIGEFVDGNVETGATCTPTKDYLSTPKYYQFFPCSAIGPREPKTSQAIVMAKKEFYFRQKDLTKTNWWHEKPIARGVHVLWRMSEYWCSKHRSIQPFAYMLTKKNREQYVNAGGRYSGARTLRKIPNYWLHPKWYGAADVIFPVGELDCSELAINDDTGKVSAAAANSWLTTISTRVTLGEDSWHPNNRPIVPGNQYMGQKLCQVDPLNLAQTHEAVPSFSGRCIDPVKRWVSRSYRHKCNLDINSMEFEAVRPQIDEFDEFPTYITERFRNLQAKCNQPCETPDPNSTQHYDIMKRFPRREGANGTEYDMEVHQIRSKLILRKMWRARKYHGSLCSVVGFFFTPMYIFMARYYKETYMNIVHFGAPVWYWIHVGGAIMAASLLGSAYTALSTNIPMWGRSMESHAVLHRNAGYVSLSIFAILLVFGGCRGGLHYRRSRWGKLVRHLSLLSHAILGFAHHLLNLYAIYLSTWIPQSPSLKDCDTKNGFPIGQGPIFIIALVFLVMDVFFHLFLSVAQYEEDREIGIFRATYLPIVPLLSMLTVRDFRGSRKRKRYLKLYLCITLSCAMAATGFIIAKDLPQHCVVGPMSCEHLFGCSPLAIKYETWYFNRGGTSPQSPPP